MNRKKLNKIFLNNISLAILLSLPFIILVNIAVSKFEVEVEGPINLFRYKYLFFNDLDGDGNSDKIYFGLNNAGN